MDGVRTSRLSFKGSGPVSTDKSRKKRKNKDKDKESSGGSGSHKRTKNEAIDLDGWTFCDTAAHVAGPIAIASAVCDPPALLLCAQKQPSKSSSSSLPEWTLSFSHLPTQQIDGAAALDDLQGADAPAVEVTMASIEPLSAAQVFVAKRLPGSSKLTFKSAFDKYVGCNKLGAVTCDMEAAGPAEEWDLIVRDDGFALQSMFGGFLSVQPDGSLRADVDTIGFKETLRFKCQAANKHRIDTSDGDAASRSAAKGGGDAPGLSGLSGLEQEHIKKFQGQMGSQGARFRTGGVVLDTQALIDASKDGRLNEELLLRRAKTKSDKFCK
eukprot:jgi/Hompol1/380/HPOL_000238-RA